MTRFRHASTATFLLVALATMPGCYNFRLSSHYDKPVTISGPGGGTPFTMTYKNWYLLDGLIPISEPNFDDKLATWMVDGNGVRKISVETKHSVVDVIIMAVTFGLVAPLTIEVTGEQSK